MVGSGATQYNADPTNDAGSGDQAAAALARIGSVWQSYQLIDTQWPTQPKVPPADPNGGLPDAVTNKPGGNPTPVNLTNVTMETYFQAGNQAACNQEEGNNNPPSCPKPYNRVTPGTAIAAFTPDPVSWNSTLNGGTTPVKPGITTQIMATAWDVTPRPEFIRVTRTRRTTRNPAR